MGKQCQMNSHCSVAASKRVFGVAKIRELFFKFGDEFPSEESLVESIHSIKYCFSFPLKHGEAMEYS